MVEGHLRGRARRPEKSLSIAILGAGRLGTALGKRLSQAGYRVARINSRGPRNDRALASDVVWFSVPDGEIARLAAALAGRSWSGKIAFHSSGVLSSDVLSPVARAGARIASVHPLMTFVRGSLPDLRGVSFAIEGDKPAVLAAERIVRRLGGEPFSIARARKSAYHAFATMVCPLLVAWLEAAEQTAALARMPAREARHRMRPIVFETLRNYWKLGPGLASSGPVVRGDTGTLELHLKLLARLPDVQRAYGALVQVALERLPAKHKPAMRALLGRVSRQKTRGSSRRTPPASRRAARQS